MLGQSEFPKSPALASWALQRVTLLLRKIVGVRGSEPPASSPERSALIRGIYMVPMGLPHSSN